MRMGFRSFFVIQAAAVATLEVVVCQVEAKYKALLFKKQITVYVEKIYGIIRGDFNEEPYHTVCSGSRLLTVSFHNLLCIPRAF
nr:unconventional myosin [Tanacetum cinerariifolium]